MIYKSLNYLDVLRKKFQIWKKKKRIFHKCPNLKQIKIDVITQHKFRKLWKPFGKPSNDWIRIYKGINNKQDYRYVPESIYYTEIEPRLNNRIYTLAYADKNNYDKLLAYNSILPKTFLRKINGVFYDEYYHFLSLNKAEQLFIQIPVESILIKPSSESAGGRGIMILQKKLNRWENDQRTFDIRSLNIKYPHNFIIQERLFQQSFFKKFNLTSVNTVRIFTYRSVKDNQIHVLHSVMRVGKKGSTVDNQASGGISIGIDESGVLNSFAISKYGIKFTEINGISLNSDHNVPYLKIMKGEAEKLAQEFYYNRLLAFDFCLDENNKIRLLEVNLQNIEINFLQMNNGPLFGDFTEEIIEYCKYAPKSVKFDFYV